MKRIVHSVQSPDGKRYSTYFQTDVSTRDSWASVLSKWHLKPDHFTCQCSGHGDRSLHIRRLPTGAYTLVKNDDTGPNHDVDCRFYGASLAENIRAAYQDGVLVEEANGNLRIRLQYGRSLAEPSTNPSPPATNSIGGTTGKARQAAMTLRGLLDVLWMQAGLNQNKPSWKAARGNIASVNGRLLVAAESIMWGRSALLKNLVVGSAPPRGGLAKHNESVQTSLKKNRHRGIVIGLLKSFDEKLFAANQQVPIDGSSCIVPVMPRDIYERTNVSFWREIAAWKKGSPTYVAMCVEPSANGRDFVLLQMVLMRVSPRFIPLDSGYEADVEEVLADQGRWFDKPLRFDAHHDLVLPDFRLLDHNRNKPFPMEVFGRNDIDYVARMNEKVAYYDQAYGATGWWRWHALIDPMMPDLPAKGP